MSPDGCLASFLLESSAGDLFAGFNARCRRPISSILAKMITQHLLFHLEPLFAFHLKTGTVNTIKYEPHNDLSKEVEMLRKNDTQKKTPCGKLGFDTNSAGFAAAAQKDNCRAGHASKPRQHTDGIQPRAYRVCSPWNRAPSTHGDLHCIRPQLNPVVNQEAARRQWPSNGKKGEVAWNCVNRAVARAIIFSYLPNCMIISR